MDRQEIVNILENYGFSIKNDCCWEQHRLEEDNSRGSLYVADNSLLATGEYVSLQDQIPSTDRDHKGYPIWRDQALTLVLDLIINERA